MEDFKDPSIKLDELIKKIKFLKMEDFKNNKSFH